MPVINHPVHPSTRIGSDHRYPCWNRPDRFKGHYTAPNRRYFPDGRFVVESVGVKFDMSDDCRYDGNNGKAGGDPCCAGCRHYKKSGHLAFVQEHGK